MFLINIMFDKAISENGGTSRSVPDCYKNQQLVIKPLKITLMHFNLFMNVIKCVIKLLILILLQQNFVLNTIRLNKCVTKQLIDVFFVFDSIPD